ncbi:ParB N-terminal domain-containing protein [Sphingomonas sp. ABOLH]|uniref:ParB/RepB/Spo0J family partition protein n=1 Tax=Sphingomonas sp. ABOLH TaxID=1985881 RepID=UPI000F7E467E|nr:ParB N-terminal domain-containing protein [Sphingomonas sp. ABOLH]RSV18673.1 hypothetical protein CA237_18745 [Sphingomonas sp. ABOLH]
MDNQIDLAFNQTVSDEPDITSVQTASHTLPAGAATPLVDFEGPEDTSVLGSVTYCDPAICHPFDGAPRAGYRYNDQRDADLTADITAHGIIEPLILTKVSGRCVILSGNRRHAVVMHLRAQGIEIRLPVRVAVFNRLKAVAFATACNVGRSAPTPMELGRSVRWTLDHVETSQAAVARALGMDQAKISHLCVLASLPDWVTDIVTDPEALSENFAAMIGPGLADAGQRQVMKERAQQLAAANVTLAGPAAARYLRTGERSVAASEIRGADGTTIGSINRDPRGGLSLRLSPKWQKVGGDPAGIVKVVTEALAAAMRHEP